MLMYLNLLVMMILTFIMMLLSNLISKKTLMSREKLSPFECGFDPKTFARMPFSLQFFLVAMIFLIFDVEITLLMPLIKLIKTVEPINLTIISSIFIFILLLGLYHEWKQGALNWKI